MFFEDVSVGKHRLIHLSISHSVSRLHNSAAFASGACSELDVVANFAYLHYNLYIN